MWKMQSLKSFTPTLLLSKSKAHDTTPTIGSKLAVLRRQLIQFSLRLRAKSSIIIHLNTKAGQYSRGVSMNQGQCIAMTIGKCRTPDMVLMITITKTKALQTLLLQITTGRIRNLRVDKISYKQLRIQVISKQDFNFFTMLTQPNLVSDNVEEVVTLSPDISYHKTLVPNLVQNLSENRSIFQ